MSRFLTSLRANIVLMWARLVLSQPIFRGSRGRLARLDHPLVVSLTSYPPRYPTLHLTLRALLRQSVQPDKLILWIAHGDYDELPKAVSLLERHGLEIRKCEDLRSYKKIVPSLLLSQASHIVIADDDVFYGKRWLERLVRVHVRHPGSVIYYRGHRPLLAPDGQLLPYKDWMHDCRDQGETSIALPTGVGGVLYPEGSLGGGWVKQDTYLHLCPNGDDLWLNLVARRNGRSFLKTAQSPPIIAWRGSQDVSLALGNLHGGQNDEQLKRIEARYGPFLSTLREPL